MPFDAFRGERANLDVLVRAADEHGPVVAGVEAKADETFGDTVEETLVRARKRLADHPRSKRVERLRRLATGFGLDLGRPETLELRYQLLTLTAATLAEARRRQAARAVVIVHEFVNAPHARREARPQRPRPGRIPASRMGPCGAASGPGTVAGPFASDGPCRLYIGKTQTVL